MHLKLLDVAAFVFVLIQLLRSSECNEGRPIDASLTDSSRSPLLTNERDVKLELGEHGLPLDPEIKTIHSELAPSRSGLVNIFKGILTLMLGITENLADNAPAIFQHTEKVLTISVERLASALQTLSSKLLDTGDQLLRYLFTDMQQHVIELRDELNRLEQNIDYQFDTMVTYLNESLINHTDDIDMSLANLKRGLRTANDTHFYNETCQIVDTFIANHVILLKQCCNISIKPVQLLCQGARAIIAKALHALADTVERIQQCLEDKNSYVEYMVPCIKTAVTDIKAVIMHTAELRHRLKDFPPMKVYYSSCCLSVALVVVDRHPRPKTDT